MSGVNRGFRHGKKKKGNMLIESTKYQAKIGERRRGERRAGIKEEQRHYEGGNRNKRDAVAKEECD